MSTRVGTIPVAGAPTRSLPWTAIATILAAAALIMSAVALVRVERPSIAVTGTVAPLWDTGRLEAMEGRMVAETVISVARTATLWDADKLDALQGRLLAEVGAADGSVVLWDVRKLDAMQGRAAAG